MPPPRPPGTPARNSPSTSPSSTSTTTSADPSHKPTHNLCTNLHNNLASPSICGRSIWTPATVTWNRKPVAPGYQFFSDLIRDGVVQKVALGHTRSDQAETVLFRLLRGAGSAGLAGIRP